MTAERHLLRLTERGVYKGPFVETNCDPADDDRCRELLEERVMAVRGTLRLDLSHFTLEICPPSGGRVIRFVSVDKSGRTTFTR